MYPKALKTEVQQMSQHGVPMAKRRPAERSEEQIDRKSPTSTKKGGYQEDQGDAREPRGRREERERQAVSRGMGIQKIGLVQV
jgi:hypothetical protein